MGRVNAEKPNRKQAPLAACFLVVAVAWTLLDQVTKGHFAGMRPGGILAGPFAGIFDIRLVHNTGGAWGIFSDSTFALGVFSTVVCAAIALYFFATIRQANLLQAVGFALVVGGGIGNAVDRFTLGYVNDFIEFSFFDFPVFNVADIGVTCGLVLVILGLLLSWRDGRGEGDGR